MTEIMRVLVFPIRAFTRPGPSSYLGKYLIIVVINELIMETASRAPERIPTGVLNTYLIPREKYFVNFWQNI